MCILTQIQKLKKKKGARFLSLLYLSLAFTAVTKDEIPKAEVSFVKP